MTNRTGYKHHDTDNAEEINKSVQGRIGFKHYDDAENVENVESNIQELDTNISPTQIILQSKIANICSLIVSENFTKIIEEQKIAYIQELLFLVSANTEMDLKQMPIE